MECCDNNSKELQAKIDALKAQYAEKVKPVEKCIIEHPIPSMLVAAGAGILIGALIGKYVKR
jgi:ElaB/YqjD/DUF883 family membrane-anchored ribosome-binding protein